MQGPEYLSTADLEAFRDLHHANGLSEAKPIAPVLLPRFDQPRLINPGGQGDAWLMRDTSAGGLVVVKVYGVRPGQDEHARDVLSLRLIRPDVPVIQVIDAGKDQLGRLYVVQKYINGDTLRVYRDLNGPIPIDKAVSIVLCLCRGVQVLHEHEPAGVVHRDLNPNNVMYDGGPVIIDLGLSIRIGNIATGGTPWFSAPECLAGPSAGDVRSDVYSLAAILLFLVADRPDTVPKCAQEHEREVARLLRPIRGPRRFSGPIPRIADLARIIGSAMSWNAANRQGSASLLAQQLQAFLDARPIPGEKHGPLRLAEMAGRRRPALISGTVLAFTLVAWLALSNLDLARQLVNEQALRLAGLMQRVFYDRSPDLGTREETIEDAKAIARARGVGLDLGILEVEHSRLRAGPSDFHAANRPLGLDGIDRAIEMLAPLARSGVDRARLWLAVALHVRAWQLAELGRYDEAIAVAAESNGWVLQVRAPQHDSVRRHDLAASIAIQRARLLRLQASSSDVRSLAAVEQAISAVEKADEVPAGQSAASGVLRVAARIELARCRGAAGDLDAASRDARAAVAIAREVHGLSTDQWRALATALEAAGDIACESPDVGSLRSARDLFAESGELRARVIDLASTPSTIEELAIVDWKLSLACLKLVEFEDAARHLDLIVTHTASARRGLLSILNGAQPDAKQARLLGLLEHEAGSAHLRLATVDRNAPIKVEHIERAVEAYNASLGYLRLAPDDAEVRLLIEQIEARLPQIQGVLAQVRDASGR